MNGDITQPPILDSGGMGSGGYWLNPYDNNLDSSEGSLKYQLDSSDLIKKIRLILLGYYENEEEDGNVKLIHDKKRQLINEDGMNTIEPMLRSYLDKVFILSDLDETQIENITLNAGQDLRDLITINFLTGNHWEIRNLATASTIKNIILAQIFATLSKAKNRGFQQYLRTVTRLQEVSAYKGSLNPYDQQPQKDSGLGKIPIIGRWFK